MLLAASISQHNLLQVSKQSLSIKNQQDWLQVGSRAWSAVYHVSSTFRVSEMIKCYNA